MRKSQLKTMKRLKRFLNPVSLALVLTVLVSAIVRIVPSDKFYTVYEYWLLAGAFVAHLILGLLLNRVNKARSSTRPASISSPEDLGAKLYALSRTLGDAGRSLRRIEVEISARESMARKLATKTQQLDVAAKIREGDAKKISDLLTQKINENLKEMNRGNRKTSWIFFVSGLIFSVPIGIFINTYW